MAATHEDANLIMQIVSWGSAEGLNDAVAAIWSDSFDPERAQADDANIRKVLAWGEIIGTFVKNGLLDRDLVFDMFAVEEMWKRVGPAARKSREHSGVPRLWENFELLASQVPAGVA